MNRAVEFIAIRSWEGRQNIPWCCALPALISSAAAPVPCGEAIDVPFIITYPGGRVYVPPTGAPFCQSGVEEIAAPDATRFGLNAPSSAGPLELNGWRLSTKLASEP